jgi:hypothetical protein
VAAKLVSLLGLAAGGTFGDQIRVIWSKPSSEALQGALGINVLNTYARASSRGPLQSFLYVRPGREREERESPSEPPSGRACCEGYAGQVEGQIEANQQSAALVDGLVKPLKKFAPIQ